MFTSIVCLVTGAIVAVIWKSWRLTYDSEGFFFRNYDGKAKEYTYADITAIDNGCLYVGERKLTRLNDFIPGGQEFLKYALIQSKKQRAKKRRAKRNIRAPKSSEMKGSALDIIIS